jgi:spore germination protein GerM
MKIHSPAMPIVRAQHNDGGTDRPIKPCRLVTLPAVRVAALALTLVVAAGLSACTQRTILSMHGDGTEGRSAHERKFAQVRIWFVKERKGALDLVPVVRTVSAKSMVHDAISELLLGPSKQEMADGLMSEIPRGTVLIGVNDTGADIELNLSRRFASGGGDSLETRLEQLRRTLSDSITNRKVYLDVEGKRLSEAAGEGLEIKQPINM